MSRSPDSGQLDLADVFLRVQAKLLADLTIGGVFEHPSANGTASERLWLDLFARYLPKRYRAAPAFIINSSGRRSRQIDIAILEKAASVRKLRRNNRKIIAGILATSSVWQPATFKPNIRRLVRNTHLDFGCALEHGAFEHRTAVSVSHPNRALIFFLLRLVTHLNRLAPAPKPNLLDYLNRAA